MRNIKNSHGDFSIWLKFAEEDLLSARALFKEKIYNQVCFHAQQAVEKTLKAFLKSQKIIPPKILSLLELLELCKENNKSFVGLRKGCAYLSRFYVPTRYPDIFPGSLPSGLPNLKEAKNSLAYAQEIMEVIKKALKIDCS